MVGCLPVRMAPPLALAFPLAVACSGSVVSEGGAGTSTGAGGAGGGHASSTSTATTSTTTSSSTPMGTGGAGGVDAGPACVSCSKVLSAGPAAGALCGPSQSLWDAYFHCACVTMCPFPCGGSMCKAAPVQPPQACIDCLGASCAAEAQACHADP